PSSNPRVNEVFGSEPMS
ncbi:CBS domain protein, partial [Vibrio parahaemolyticus EKP-028]